jgi:hypothetical protein
MVVKASDGRVMLKLWDLGVPLHRSFPASEVRVRWLAAEVESR